jgi:diguanylate cyclase (GGDEF)-like protein
VTIRVLRDDDRLELAAWTGITDAAAARLPVFRRDEGWIGQVLETGRPIALTDARKGGLRGFDRYAGVLEFAGDLVTPLTHHDRVIGALAAVTYEPRVWTQRDLSFIKMLATHASIAIVNAELFEQTEARAAQLGVLQAASARMSRATTIKQVGRALVEETRGIIDYHNARVYLIEPPDDVMPIAFEGRVGAYERVDFALLQCKLGEGFTGWVAQHGEAMLVNDANADPRGASIAGTDDVDESMLVVPMRKDGSTVGVITLSKLGLGQFGPEDLRLLSILADQAATALESVRLLARSQDLAGELQRLLDMSSALSASLDPREVADLMARHLALALGVDECAISYWDRDEARVVSLGYYPPIAAEELEPFFEVAGYPQTQRVLERQQMAIVDVDDPTADPAEVELLRRDGNRALAMLPLVAKGQSIGLVELLSKSTVTWGDQRLQLAQTMANEAAMALENARLYEDARKLADRDPLTGFYNHRYLHERLGEEVVRAQRARRPLSVLMLDLDDFKLVNDTFGHLFGDRVLTWTAELIRSTLRASDVPARYGGDEFAIILPETDGDDARSAAERILEAFRDRPFVGEHRGPVPIAASIGVATYPTDGRTPTDLIAAADRALYRVKRDGGHDAAAAGTEAA